MTLFSLYHIGGGKPKNLVFSLINQRLHDQSRKMLILSNCVYVLKCKNKIVTLVSNKSKPKNNG